MTNSTVKQHTVPQCFLRNFSDNKTHIFYKKKEVNKDKIRNYELNKPW